MSEQAPAVPMPDESFEFEFETDGRGDIREKVSDLKRFAVTHHLLCTGVIHPKTGTVSVKLEPIAPPPAAVRVRQLLKHAGRTLGLRCVTVKYHEEQHEDYHRN